MQSHNDAGTSAAAAAYMQQKQNNGAVEDLVTEQSTILTNFNFFKSRQYGTISPEFRKEAIYVMGWANNTTKSALLNDKNVYMC